MEDPRIVFVIVLLFFVWFSPNRSTLPLPSPPDRTHDLDGLNNASSYGDLLKPTVGLNLTGFRPRDGYHWEALPQIFGLLQEQYQTGLKGDDQSAALYRRYDGQVRGDFAKLSIEPWDSGRSYNLTHLDPRATYFSSQAEYNVTTEQGTVILSLEDAAQVPTQAVQEIKGVVSLADYGSRHVSGFHLQSGLVLLTSVSHKFNSIPARPHLIPPFAAVDEYQNATIALNQSLVASRKEFQLTAKLFFAAPTCELVIWLIPYRIPPPQSWIDSIETELANPTGAPIGQPPLLAFSGLIFAPDCGYLLHLPVLSGLKSELELFKTTHFILALLLTSLGQAVLLRQQVGKSTSPSAKTRISHYSILITVCDDIVIFVLVLALALIEPSVYLLASAAAFSSIMTATLGLQYAITIKDVQDVRHPTQRRPDQTVSDAANNDPARLADPQIPLSEAGLPLPVTTPVNAANPASRPATTAVSTTAIMQETMRNQQISGPASLYTQFCMTMMVLAFVSLWALSWSSLFRGVWIFALTTAVFSLWWPQIIHNIIRNSYPLRALSIEFIIGNSLLRTVPFLYVFLTRRNLLNFQSRPGIAVWMAGWMTVQLLILAAQEYIDPRLGLSSLIEGKKWVPTIYDYHRVLYDDDAESAVLLTLTSGRRGSMAEKDKSAGLDQIFDCTICMNEVRIPLRSRMEELRDGKHWLLDKSYMITPCRHVFHTDCLEGWMDLRLVCPDCREDLPAV